MTRLLVSVRDAREAADALAGGADLLDVKEPLVGALGRAPSSVWQEVVRVADSRVEVSVALGELLDQPPPDPQELLGVRYAKIGLAGCRRIGYWPERCREFFAPLRQHVRPVAVIYVDEERAAAPRAEEILDSAPAWGCEAVLLDTYHKSAGGLFDHVSPDRLQRLLAGARNRGWLTVVGGSLTADNVALACQAGPDVVAVRGAACAGGRNAALDRDRVQQLAALVRQVSTTQNEPPASDGAGAPLAPGECLRI